MLKNLICVLYFNNFLIMKTKLLLSLQVVSKLTTRLNNQIHHLREVFMWMKIKMAFAIILKPARIMFLPEEEWLTAEAMEEETAPDMARHMEPVGGMHMVEVMARVTDGEEDLEEARHQVWAEAR